MSQYTKNWDEKFISQRKNCQLSSGKKILITTCDLLGQQYLLENCQLHSWRVYFDSGRGWNWENFFGTSVLKIIFRSGYLKLLQKVVLALSTEQVSLQCRGDGKISVMRQLSWHNIRVYCVALSSLEYLMHFR